MQPRDAAGWTYDVRAYHATRPGFRVTELQLGPSQMVPWHYHTKAQDTFYVIDGTIRILTREPEGEMCLMAGQTCSLPPGRHHCVANAGDTSAVLLILQGIGEHDFIAIT